MDKKEVSCLFCPSTMADSVEDLRKMSIHYFPLHVSACHIDLKKKNAGEPPAEYVCDGNGQGVCPSCTPTQKHKTLAVNSYVDHMAASHPDQTIPVSFRYKAALSDFMAEFCTYVANTTTGTSVADKRREMYDFVVSAPQPIRAENSNLVSNRDSSSATSEAAAADPTPATEKEVSLVANTEQNRKTLEPASAETLALTSSVGLESEATETSGPIPTESSEAPPAKVSSPLPVQTSKARSFGTTEAISAASSEQESTESAGAVSTSSMSPVTKREGATSYQSSHREEKTQNMAASTDRRRSKRLVSSTHTVRAATERLKASKHRGVGKLSKPPMKKADSRRTSSAANTDKWMLECMKCHRKISIRNCAATNAFSHAALHMVNKAFECRLCGAKYHTHPAWFAHFNHHHSKVKCKTTKGHGAYTAFIIDKREKLKEEIAKVMKECFDM